VEDVVIASPTHTHKQMALVAAKQGKPTVCEKPTALSHAEDARDEAGGRRS
jgi:predicted dehydrogenase